MINGLDYETDDKEKVGLEGTNEGAGRLFDQT